MYLGYVHVLITLQNRKVFSLIQWHKYGIQVDNIGLNYFTYGGFHVTLEMYSVTHFSLDIVSMTLFT